MRKQRPEHRRVALEGDRTYPPTSRAPCWRGGSTWARLLGRADVRCSLRAPSSSSHDGRQRTRPRHIPQRPLGRLASKDGRRSEAGHKRPAKSPQLTRPCRHRADTQESPPIPRVRGQNEQERPEPRLEGSTQRNRHEIALSQRPSRPPPQFHNFSGLGGRCYLTSGRPQAVQTPNPRRTVAERIAWVSADLDRTRTHLPQKPSGSGHPQSPARTHNFVFFYTRDSGTGRTQGPLSRYPKPKRPTPG